MILFGRWANLVWVKCTKRSNVITGYDPGKEICAESRTTGQIGKTNRHPLEWLKAERRKSSRVLLGAQLGCGSLVGAMRIVLAAATPVCMSPGLVRESNRTLGS